MGDPLSPLCTCSHALFNFKLKAFVFSNKKPCCRVIELIL